MTRSVAILFLPSLMMAVTTQGFVSTTGHFAGTKRPSHKTTGTTTMAAAVAVVATKMPFLAPVPTTTATAVEWEIRHANDADLSTVRQFMEQKNAFDRGLNGEKDGLKPKVGRQLNTLFPELPTGQVLFATDPDNDMTVINATHDVSIQPTGFCVYALKYYGLDVPPLLYLHDLFVDPSLRSRGAGSALMDRLALIAQERRCTHLAWDLDERNVKGQKFYQRLGAVITGQKGVLKKMEWRPTM